MTRSFQETKDLLTNATANATGVVMDVADFRHLILAIDTSNSASFTIKVQGSIQDVVKATTGVAGTVIGPPDFTAGQAQDNQWTYIQLLDLNDQSSITGATGIVLSGTDTHRMFEVNTNGLKWLTVTLSSYSAGNGWIRVKPFNDTH